MNRSYNLRSEKHHCRVIREYTATQCTFCDVGQNIATKYEVRAKLMDIVKRANLKYKYTRTHARTRSLKFPCAPGEKIGDGIM